MNALNTVAIANLSPVMTNIRITANSLFLYFGNAASN
jgi:hypothetical protein